MSIAPRRADPVTETEEMEAPAVVCDVCGRHALLINGAAVPATWLTVRQGDGPDAPTWHFDRDTCLTTWQDARTPQDAAADEHAAGDDAAPRSVPVTAAAPEAPEAAPEEESPDAPA